MVSDGVLVTFLNVLVHRSPDAMRAATQEVKRVLESSDQKADPMNPHLVMSREQLDNLPVLGTIIFRSVLLLLY